MNTAEALIRLLEEDGVKHIFGHPGEQILPFYKALKDSSIEHILTRHEQGAAHAADAYARSSGDYGLCVSTAGPGAMNLVMGLATAFKDSVPLLVFTGDNDYHIKDEDFFQNSPINGVFENITVKSFHPYSAKSAIFNLIEALVILKKYPKGPVHINLSRDILLEDVDLGDIDFKDMVDSFDHAIFSDIDSDLDIFNEKIPNVDNLYELVEIFDKYFRYFDGKLVFIEDSLENTMTDVDNNINLAIEKVKVSRKPLVVVGNGIVWGKAIKKLSTFVSKTWVPIATTFHSKGIISESDKLNLGLLGLRGTSLANYAYENSDCILVLGARLSERTIASCDYDSVCDKVIHVNIDETCLEGNINLPMDASDFLDLLLDEIESKDYKDKDFILYQDWINEIYSNYEELVVDGIDDIEDNYITLRPPYAINKIVNAFKGSYFLSDAGTHTTWTTLLSKNDKFGKLLFSGGFGPMGYGLAASVGVAIAHPDDPVVVICGDGDIQMVIQELATIIEYDLNVNVFIIDNSQLGIIRQWEETVYDMDRYQIDLKNPDFVKLADAYGIDSVKVESKEDLELAIDNAFSSSHAFLADVCVCQENIPLPK
ncbi:thiamine pyrophosphate-binding protein [Methanobrevibacter sp.]|uniref:thiamine pyrophosphate-binding protein n=1 Tax=Methanobrevibacter sp. TaxID=66852 RepID=UPI0025FA117B|nr:thiamine pyrophosphate-binding protein [Methanobrevibacter sp.]MBQ2962750.1 thiamine pyrophosphate-binding protein [Methanobrevibacter sp.]